MDYEVGDRVRILGRGAGTLALAGALVKITRVNVDGNPNKIAVIFEGKNHVILKNTVDYYVPNIGDRVITYPPRKEVEVASADSTEFHADNGDVYPCRDIIDVIHRGQEQEQGDTMNYKVGDKVLIGYASEVPSKLRGKTVEVANEKLDDSILVNAEGIRYTILVSCISCYIPNVGDIVNTEEQSGISVTSVDLHAFKDIDGNLYLAKNIRRVVSRAPKAPIIKDGDIVEPIDTKRFSDIPRKVGLVSNGLLLLQGNPKRHKSSDFKLSTRVLPEGLVAITDEGHTYLLYDNLAFVDVLKDKYFITCLILPQMLNGATEVEYVKHGLHTEITFSNKGIKLDGSVKAVISYLNSIITG